jgi:nucleotide-binding universal stress UspA family protein
MNIVVAVDFSEVTRRILEVVEGVSEGRAMHLYLIHVAAPDPAFVGWEAGPDVVRQQVATDLRREHRDVEALATELRDTGRDVTALCVQGPTVDMILAQADQLQADLIVVGSHGHGATYDLLVGSVSSGVIRKSRVPVLVVPARN